MNNDWRDKLRRELKEKQERMNYEDKHDRLLYSEWRSYVYRYVLLLLAIIGFSATLFGTDTLVDKIQFQELLNSYIFLGISILVGFASIGYSIYKERKMLWGKMMWTIAGKYLEDKEFEKISDKTKKDYWAKKLYDGVNSGVRIYPIVFGILTVICVFFSFVGFYFLVKSLF